MKPAGMETLGTTLDKSPCFLWGVPMPYRKLPAGTRKKVMDLYLKGANTSEESELH